MSVDPSFKQELTTRPDKNKRVAPGQVFSKKKENRLNRHRDVIFPREYHYSNLFLAARYVDQKYFGWQHGFNHPFCVCGG